MMKQSSFFAAALIACLSTGCATQDGDFEVDIDVAKSPMGPCGSNPDADCDDYPETPNGTPYASIQFLQGFFALDVPLRAGQPDGDGVYALHTGVASWLSSEPDAASKYFKAKLVRKLVRYFSHVSIAIPANAGPGDFFYLPAETVHGQGIMRHDLSAASLGTQQLKEFVEQIMVLSVNNNYQQGSTPVVFVSDATGPDGQTLLKEFPVGRVATLMPEYVASYTVVPWNSSYYTNSGGDYVNDAQLEYVDPVSGTTKRMVLEYAVTGKNPYYGSNGSYLVAMSDFVWNKLQEGVDDGQNVIAPPMPNVPPSAWDAGVCRFCSGNAEECGMETMRPVGDGIAMMRVKVQPTAEEPYAVSGVHGFDDGPSEYVPSPRVGVFIPEEAIPTLYNCDFTGSSSSE